MNSEPTKTLPAQLTSGHSVATMGFVCACAVAIAYSTNYTNHAPLVPMLIKQFGITKAMAGLLTTGIFLTHGLMQIPGGHLADTYGGDAYCWWRWRWCARVTSACHLPRAITNCWDGKS